MLMAHRWWIQSTEEIRRFRHFKIPYIVDLIFGDNKIISKLSTFLRLVVKMAVDGAKDEFVFNNKKKKKKKKKNKNGSFAFDCWWLNL